MDYCTLDTIDAENMQTVRTKTAERIARYRREAASIRRLADTLDGRYITARILPEIKATLKHDKVYMGKGNAYITAYYGCYPDYDRIDLYLKNRRADGASMRRDADGCEACAAKLEKALDDMDYLVHEYNAIAAEYAAIRSGLCILFNDLPRADFTLQQICDRATYTPDEFAALIS